MNYTSATTKHTEILGTAYITNQSELRQENEMSWLTMSNVELLEALDNKKISPSKIIGGGYKSSAIARRLAREYLLEQIKKEEEAK